jgi:predicted lipoprotein with Yx(FWY)xxD motif
VKKSFRNSGVLIAIALTAAACSHTKALAPEGGSLGLSPSSGAGGTNAPSLNGSSTSNASKYNGAGYQTPVFTSTTVPNSYNDVPLGPTTIKVENTKYGQVLASPSGHTLYMRIGDSPTYAGCKSTCAIAFPPILTNGAPQASGGILAAYLGVLTAPTRGEQIAYAGHPLYTYSGDTAPGMVSAENAGGIWFAVTPTGAPLRVKAAG